MLVIKLCQDIPIVGFSLFTFFNILLIIGLYSEFNEVLTNMFVLFDSLTIVSDPSSLNKRKHS